MAVEVSIEQRGPGIRAVARITNRDRDHRSMLDLLVTAGASEHLGQLTRAFVDSLPAPDREAWVRIERQASASVLDSLVHVARAHGWRP